jgi:Na+-driven multidrug efflux pump
LLIPPYGAKGAAISSTISYSLAAIIYIGVFSRETRIPVKEMWRYRRSDFELVFSLLTRIKQKTTA